MTGEDFEFVLREYLGTPSAGSEFAHAFLFFGRIPRGVLPYVHVEQSCEDAVSARERHMLSEKLELVSDFQVGDHVRVQHAHQGLGFGREDRRPPAGRLWCS